MERTGSAFTGVKVFSATVIAQREKLGSVVTEWLNARPELELVDAIVKQSSDARFHCVSILLFYRAA